MIDDDTEPTQSNGVSSHEEDDGDDSGGGGGGGGGVVWQLENKYYTARVRLLPCAERARRPPRAGAAHAHLIYLTEDEVSPHTNIFINSLGIAPLVCRSCLF